ncbi:MAG: PAS domain-containing protein, partial [Deltaproteobacteria bacterium]
MPPALALPSAQSPAIPSVGIARSEGARRLAGLVLIRLLVVSALFGAALSMSFSSTGEDATTRTFLYAYLITAYAASALEFVWLLGRWQPRALAWTHVFAETLLAGWLVALTGGTEGPFTFLLLLSTVHGALAAGSSGAFAAAVLSTAELAALAGGVPLLGLVGSEPGRAAVAVFANSGGCFATAALSSYLTDRLSRTGQALDARERELQRLGELYRNVVQSLGSGLMTLGSGGEVLFVNGAGAEILGLDPEATRGRPLDQVAPELARTGLDGRG